MLVLLIANIIVLPVSVSGFTGISLLVLLITNIIVLPVSVSTEISLC